MKRRSNQDGAKTRPTIPKPVLQSLIDGKILGIAIRPHGVINAAFYAPDAEGKALAPRLRQNIQQ
jgi:hypothetical protein